MKIWFDACTGKHVRLGAVVGKRLRNLGCDVLLTTRQHPDTIPIAKFIGEEFKVVGKYDPTSLLSMLRQSAQRQLLFCEMFKKRRPDLAVAHGSVELCRVAFGLNIPVVSVHDTPHNEIVKRLTLPLIDFLVVSQAIPARHWQGYGIKSIVQFDGVDEVAWIRDYEGSSGVKYEKPLIVVRQFEAKAAYGKAKADIMEKLAIKLTSLGKVVFLPRYDRRQRNGLIVPQHFLDSVDLVKHADLVVTVGGTISREAALLGTPSLVVPINRIGRGAVNNYLSKKGFPLYNVDASEVFDYAKKYIGKTKDVKNLLSKLEDPVSKIEKIVEEEKRK